VSIEKNQVKETVTSLLHETLRQLVTEAPAPTPYVEQTRRAIWRDVKALDALRQQWARAGYSEDVRQKAETDHWLGLLSPLHDPQPA
jgi:hypothetical protein